MCFRIRGEYLEREAELSGSEAGSEDEDEEGLDRLMAEEGDLDDVDEEAVRDEVCLFHFSISWMVKQVSLDIRFQTILNIKSKTSMSKLNITTT